MVLQNCGVYKISGKVLEEFDCVNIEVDYLEKLPIIQDPRYADEPQEKEKLK